MLHCNSCIIPTGVTESGDSLSSKPIAMQFSVVPLSVDVFNNSEEASLKNCCCADADAHQVKFPPAVTIPEVHTKPKVPRVRVLIFKNRCSNNLDAVIKTYH